MRWALLALLVVACSCGVAGTPAAPSATPDGGDPTGWHTEKKLGSERFATLGKSVPSGFSIDLPPDWKVLDERRTLEQSQQVLEANYPAAAKDQRAAATEAALVLIAGAEDPDDAAYASVTVTRESYPTDVTADRLAAAVRRYREESLGALIVHSAHVDLNGLDFVYLEMKYQLRTPSGERVMLSTMQYIRVVGRQIYGIEFNAPAERSPDLAPLFRSIALTFRII